MKYLKSKFIVASLFAILIAGFIGTSFAPTANAQLGGSVIRDTEIEAILKSWAAPIVKAAGLSPDSINIILVQNNALNAFVAGGANIFIYTGLIEKTDDPGELMGVIAHELGHITGGHLIATHSALERASYESIIGMVVGAAAAIATGNGEIGTAITAGSSNLALRRFLSHSRIQESSADQAAMTYMTEAGLDPTGLPSFLAKLEDEELLPASQQSEYIRTHPISRNRVEALQTRLQKAKATGQGFDALTLEQHKRMKAKLTGFSNPGHVVWKYDDRDTSVAADYARAIAAYRQNKPDEALARIDDLIQREPENPYFLELKGQVLVDFSKIKEALPAYETAVKKLPQAPLLRVALAHALMESGGGDDVLKQAIEHLEIALGREPRSTRTHRLLATAYGRLGREDIAKLHLAEEALLQRRFDYARDQANAALESFPAGSREALRARDIINYLDNLKPE
jgi:predicted Zn-dependent protease